MWFFPYIRQGTGLIWVAMNLLIFSVCTSSHANYCSGPRYGCAFSSDEIQAIRNGMSCAEVKLRKPKDKQAKFRCSDIAIFASNSLIENIARFAATALAARPRNLSATSDSERIFSQAQGYIKRHRESLVDKAAQLQYSARISRLPHKEGEDLLQLIESYNKMNESERKRFLSDVRNRQIIEQLQGRRGVKLMLARLKEFEDVLKKDPFLDRQVKMQTLKKIRGYREELQSKSILRATLDLPQAKVNLPIANVVRKMVDGLDDFAYKDLAYFPRQAYVQPILVDGNVISGQTKFEDLPPELQRKLRSEQGLLMDQFEADLGQRRLSRWMDTNDALLSAISLDLHENGNSRSLRALSASPKNGYEYAQFEANEDVIGDKPKKRITQKDARRSIGKKLPLGLAAGATLAFVGAAHSSYVNSRDRCRYENVWFEATGSVHGNNTAQATLTGASLNCHIERKRSDQEVLGKPPGTMLRDLLDGHSNDEIVKNLQKLEKSGHRFKNGRIRVVREIDSQTHFWGQSCRLLRQLQKHYLCDGSWFSSSTTRGVEQDKSVGVAE